jgi:hypothetical protein
VRQAGNRICHKFVPGEIVKNATSYGVHDIWLEEDRPSAGASFDIGVMGIAAEPVGLSNVQFPPYDVTTTRRAVADRRLEA